MARLRPLTLGAWWSRSSGRPIAPSAIPTKVEPVTADASKSEPVQSDSASEPVVHRVRSAGATLAVEEYGRAHGDTGSAVVFLPALGVPLSYYRRFLEHWAGRGRHVFGMELRGGPQSPVADLRRDSFGYSHLVKDDLPAVLELDPITAAGKVVLVGHSLGGQLACCPRRPVPWWRARW
jgi:predicted alpha/beta hydrolase